MRVAVCIKEVPDTTEVKIDPETGTLIRQGVPSILNPFDMYALESALCIKDNLPETYIAVICMGPPSAEKNLRETIAMGADEIFLVTDRAFAGADTWATSYTLSKAIDFVRDIDIIFAGKQAIDGDTAQTGPGIAEWLQIPQLTFVRKIREVTQNKITVERSTETGYQVVECNYPVVVTVVKTEKDPRLPSLRGMMRAKKTEIHKLDCQTLGTDEKNIGLLGSPTRVHKIFTPPKRSGGTIIEGEATELAAKLATKLSELCL